MTILLSMMLFFSRSLLMLGFIIFCAGCRKQSAPPLFELKLNTGIVFTNDIENTSDFNIFSYRNFYNGGGVGIGDINNDGLADVFFTANMGSNKLYLNTGDFTFKDVTETAGLNYTEKWSTGVVMVDINNDGWLDIYVCNAGYINGKAPESKLYINNKNLTFTDSAREYGLTNTGGYATHAAFFDYDLDGDLDCFIINNSFIPVNTLNYANKRNLRAANWPVADFLKGGGDHLYRNDNGKFVDVSEAAGIHGSLISFGLGISVGDVNGDQYPDVYVSNDFFERDYLYINQQNGTFKDETEERINHTSLASMGSDMGDINNDGHPDIFSTDMLPGDDFRLRTTTSFENIDVFKLKERSGFYYQFQQNALQLNNGDGTFSDIANFSGVAATDWSWGALIFDADNDGMNDLYVCNGIKHDVTDQDFIDFFSNEVIQKMVLTGERQEVERVVSKMPSNPVVNKAYKNKDGLRFSDAGQEWGFTQPSFSNGAAYADLDNDGDLDLIVSNVGQPAFVYQNNSREHNKHNYVGIKLQGTGLNTFAIGSTVKVYSGSHVFTSDVMPSRGFQSSVDYKKIVGLGNNTRVDSIVVIWPNRTLTSISQPPINTVHTIVQQPGNTRVYTPTVNSTTPLFLQVASAFNPHIEDDYTDFYQERNIPRQLSAEGPKGATADVNGDGLPDVFIGGAAGQAGQLYLQTRTGFTKSNTQVFERFAAYEDVAVLFFDADGDGDSDLLVGSGGNTDVVTGKPMQNRLFVNNGKGDFAIDSTAMPNSRMNTSVFVAGDFDNDGDMDVFAGSRSVPQNYGLTPASYIYLNDGRGKFTDVAANRNPEIADIGMVTGALWKNIAGDSRPELVIVGEWMYPRIFQFTKDRFVELQTNLQGLHGWWQCVTSADLDGDGDEDLVLGNIGDNFYLRPTAESPVKLWIGDFNNDFEADKIITLTAGGKDMPVFLKRELTDQYPFLKKQNLLYSGFAKKSVQELFTPQVIDKAQTLLFNFTASCVALNNGGGKFTIAPLPAKVQLSSVNAVMCIDVNNDGKMDIVTGGNQFGFPPQFGRLDASRGEVLLNNGSGRFNWMSNQQSGLSLKGQVRDILTVNSNREKRILVLLNNSSPVLYRMAGGSLR